MVIRSLILAIAIASALAPGTASAAKHKTASAPAVPAEKPMTPDPAIVYTPIGPPFPAPAPGSRTPGPMLRPGSPVVNRTTIVPFPIPGDTSREAIAHSKIMNVPRVGETRVEPMPGAYLEQQGNLPVPLSGPAPIYPKAAIEAGIEGTVLVMAYVLADGTVGETRILHSIPALDDAAVQAVKRMRFRPALFRDQPGPDWVGIPVKFTLH